MHDNIIVDLVQGSDESAVIRTSDRVLGYVVIEQRGDKLVMYKKKEAPGRWKSEVDRVVVSLTIPTLDNINLRGASEVRSKGHFETDRLILALSGASEMKGFNALTKTTIVSLSGSSELECSLVGTVSLVASGASEGEINIGSAPTAVLDISGSSEIELSGAAKETNIVASGASELHADRFRSTVANIVGSGSSEVAIAVSRELSYALSGASELEVFGNPRVTGAQQSGASSFNLR